MELIPRDLPWPLQHIIFLWKIEFDRVDAMERTHAIQGSAWFRLVWGSLCSNIRECTPVYVFEILTQSGTRLSLPIVLGDCDPHRVQTGSRIPESHIAAWRRQALPSPPIVHLLVGSS